MVLTLRSVVIETLDTRKTIFESQDLGDADSYWHVFDQFFEFGD
jgi:hypothetical protein